LEDDVILNTGEVIDGKYEIISKLGQGGLGVVYKARALSLGRDVAIKMLSHLDEETLKRFSLEAKSLARFKHPAVVRIDDFGSSEKWGPYLVVAYIPGRDLGAVAQSPLPIEEAVSLTLAICSGVSACHIRSIVHRDLKPSSIRVTNETSWLERVKILDFGLALPFDSPIVKAHQTRISQFGPVDGVSRYIAPEFLRREKPTNHCDQYSIAALLYLLLTGHPPFEAFDGDALVRAIVLGQNLPPRALRPDLPVGLEAAMLRALDTDPHQRFPSVNELALAILPFGPPNLKTKGTRYFTNANGPIDRRLIEPVSAYGQGSKPDLPPRAPKDFEPLPALVSPSAPVPALPPVVSQPMEKSLRRPPGSRWLDSNAVVLFTLGAALGSAIATIIFVAFLTYRQQPPEPCSPGPPFPSHATK
jgi:serine/threonine-protein kinase